MARFVQDGKMRRYKIWKLTRWQDTNPKFRFNIFKNINRSVSPQGCPADTHQDLIYSKDEALSSITKLTYLHYFIGSLLIT